MFWTNRDKNVPLVGGEADDVGRLLSQLAEYLLAGPADGDDEQAEAFKGAEGALDRFLTAADLLRDRGFCLLTGPGVSSAALVLKPAALIVVDGAVGAAQAVDGAVSRDLRELGAADVLAGDMPHALSHRLTSSARAVSGRRDVRGRGKREELTAGRRWCRFRIVDSEPAPALVAH